MQHFDHVAAGTSIGRAQGLASLGSSVYIVYCILIYFGRLAPRCCRHEHRPRTRPRLSFRRGRRGGLLPARRRLLPAAGHEQSKAGWRQEKESEGGREAERHAACGRRTGGRVK